MKFKTYYWGVEFFPEDEKDSNLLSDLNKSLDEGELLSAYEYGFWELHHDDDDNLTSFEIGR